MTDRDTFAAAALTGLLAQGDDGSFSEESYVRGAYRWADAMLRERAKTNHDAAPAATAQDLGTGDTTKPIKGGVSDRSKPINGPDLDSRVWETPVHTPAPHATPGEGSVQRECTEPVAWAVCTPGDGDWSPCFFHEPHAQRCASAILGSKNIVPLYRSPTLTDAEAETLRELRDEAAQYADEIGLCASEVRGRQRIIDGLLVRLGGER